MPDSGAAGYLAQVAGRASSAAGYAVPVAGRVAGGGGIHPHRRLDPARMRRVLRVRLQVDRLYAVGCCVGKCSIQYIRWLLWMLLLCGRHMCSCGV